MSEDISTDFSITDAVQTAAPLGEDIQDAVGEWMEAGMNEPGHEVLDDDEIVADMLKCEDDDHEESSDEEAASSTHVTASEALMLWMSLYVGLSKQVQMLLTCYW